MRDPPLTELLGGHPLMAGLPGEMVCRVAESAISVELTHGEHLLLEGGSADALYLILTGHIAIELYFPERGPVPIDTVGPGSCLGWSWLAPPYRWHFDARSVGAVTAIALDGSQLRSSADADAVFGYALMSRIAAIVLQRLQATRVRLLDLYGDHSDR